jgi:hypothetical protein
MGSFRRSDTRLDNEMSERTSERCRNGLSLGHCMSERAGRRSRRSRTGEWKMTVRGALRPAATSRLDCTCRLGPLGRPWGPVVRLAIR